MGSTITTTTIIIAATSIGKRCCRLSRLYHQHHLHHHQLQHQQKNRIPGKPIYSEGTLRRQDQFHFHQTITNSSSTSRHFHYYHYSLPLPAANNTNRRLSTYFQHTFLKPLISSSSSILSSGKLITRSICSVNSITTSFKESRNFLPSNRLSAIFSQVRNMSTNKHLATGAPCPPLQDGLLRIYSMRYCPFAQRAVLVAEAKGIPHDVVNCNLKTKPEFLLEKNPQGQVPVIETNDGKILYESLIVAEYLDDAFPQKRPLQSSDSYKKAIDKLYIEKFGSVVRNFYGILFAIRDSEPSDVAKEKIAKFVDGLKPFEVELAKRGTTFFAGNDKPGMLDYMIWPWFERIPMIKIKLPDLFDYDEAKRQHPNMENWRQAMKKDSAVAKLYITPENHLSFAEGFLSGSPVYD